MKPLLMVDKFRKIGPVRGVRFCNSIFCIEHFFVIPVILDMTTTAKTKKKLNWRVVWRLNLNLGFCCSGKMTFRQLAISLHDILSIDKSSVRLQPFHVESICRTCPIVTFIFVYWPVVMRSIQARSICLLINLSAGILFPVITSTANLSAINSL